MSGGGARLAVFTLVEWSLETVREWAASAGHEIALLVTLSSEGAGALRSATLATGGSAAMVVPSVADCIAALSDLDVDLGVVFTFTRVPESVAGLPRHGTVNVHPSLLPAFRGPNAYRSLYAGAPQIGATLHHLTPQMDAGPILAQAAEDTPRDLDPDSARAAMSRVAAAVLEEGVPLALRGDGGTAQDSATATDAPRFSELERVLTAELDAHLFQARFSALVLAGEQPLVTLGDEVQPLRAVRRLDGLTAAAPGVISLDGRRAIVAVADCVLELALGRLPAWGEL